MIELPQRTVGPSHDGLLHGSAPTDGGSLRPGPGLAPPPAGLGADLGEVLRAGGYEVLGELGRGGMGTVYLARNILLNRPVRIKTLSAGDGGPTAAARLRAEAEAVAQLRHPNVVQIYGVGDVERWRSSIGRADRTSGTRADGVAQSLR